MDFLAAFDKFGATYKQKLRHEKKNYKTVFGGIISIVIYLLSFVYFSYKIYQYGSNSINPIQSIAFEYKESLSMEVTGLLIQFQVTNTNINPFNKNEQILVPFMFHQENHSAVASGVEFFEETFIYNNNEINFQTQIYTPKNLSLSLGNSDFPSLIVIGFQICDRSVKINCANQTTIDNFFSQIGLLIRTSVTTNQFNSFTKEINSMTRHVDFALDKTNMLYQRVIMEAQLLDIDDGVLFPASKQDWLFNDFQIQTQTIGAAYTTSFQALFMTELSISQVTSKKSVQFIKISAVLADVGSIFSSLMMISIIVSIVNEFWMEEEIALQIIGIYYPQFTKLQFKRFFLFGPIKEVKFDKKVINLELFKQFYIKAQDTARAKLTVYSTIYEISRLQFAVQSLLSRDKFNQVHLQGIQLSLLNEVVKSPRENQVSASDQILFQDEPQDNLHLIFKEEDFQLLDQFNDALEASQSSQPQHELQSQKQSSIINQLQEADK